MLGAALALSSAAFFGLNNAVVRRGVLSATILQGMSITVLLGIPVFLFFGLFLGAYAALAEMSVPAYLWMALAGVVHFVIGRYGDYRATRSLGTALSSPVQQLSVLVALALSLTFLGEEITGLKFIGLVLVLMGPTVVLARRARAREQAREKAFEPRYAEGFLWGGISALCFGTSPLFIALGLGAGGSVSDGVAGVIVSYSVAGVVVLAMMIHAGGTAYMRAMDRGASGWFLLATVLVAVSQMLRYMALSVAPVSVVVPIQRLSVVFRLIFAAILNRDTEVFDSIVVLGIIIAVSGAVALSLDTGVAAGFLAFPERIDRFLFTPWF
ncbi:EamA family transporter [Alkalilacustris brevis]|uniref:EamA family transporter n=1 Tax=Alkalilacustris brevis TaxID=2026338 RepID=UPI000E0DB833|nr:EamA family transporter [Alkalilacustris brevis]